jgi:hypothetical protein
MSTYKAISLKQPFASLVASGKKTIETRKWTTKYRGDLLICSSKNPDIYPAGCALCIVELYDIMPMTKAHEGKACIKLYKGANAWYLKNLRVLPKPVPIKGSLGIYEVRT